MPNYAGVRDGSVPTVKELQNYEIVPKTVTQTGFLMFRDG